MSTQDLRDKLDGIQVVGRVDTMYPENISRLHRGVGVSEKKIECPKVSKVARTEYRH
jgi:hypothetical protein